MKLHLLEIPAETQDLAAWVEQQIMAPTFGEFAAQLQVIHSYDNPGASQLELNQILGETQGYVVEYGMVSCSSKQIRQLLSNPEALLELQGMIFEHGSQYWLGKAGNQSVQPQILNALKTQIQEAENAVGLAPSRSTNRPANVGRFTRANSTSTRRAFGWKALAIAAGLLVMGTVGWNMLSPPDQPAVAKWGWQSEDAMPKTATPGEYLAKLSAGGNAWFDREVENTEDYIKRLTELRTGCEILINAEHLVLSSDDRQWLVDKCKSWKVKFDQQLIGVNSDPENFEKYLIETNQTVNSLVKALKEKAETV